MGDKTAKMKDMVFGKKANTTRVSNPSIGLRKKKQAESSKNTTTTKVKRDKGGRFIKK